MTKIGKIGMDSKLSGHGMGMGHGHSTRSRGSDGNSKVYHAGQASKGMVKTVKGGC